MCKLTAEDRLYIEGEMLCMESRLRRLACDHCRPCEDNVPVAVFVRDGSRHRTEYVNVHLPAGRPDSMYESVIRNLTPSAGGCVIGFAVIGRIAFRYDDDGDAVCDVSGARLTFYSYGERMSFPDVTS